eukprot:NODE_686_length_4746_cov_0.370562.p5 type:complete len:130 gc:universal NODE_686_length_4746_cov_0.370562:2000-1611(-)
MLGAASPHYAYIVAALGGLLGVIGAIIAFVYHYPTHYGVVGIILGALCLIMEVPMFRVGLLKHPILRGVWYFISGLVFLLLGIFTVNPVMGLYVAAGVLHLVASFLYVLSRFHRSNKHSHGPRAGHTRV